MDNIYIWMGVSYLAGTFFTLWIMGPQIGKNMIEKTVDDLVSKGYLRHKIINGEVEILKWNDNQNG